MPDPRKKEAPINLHVLSRYSKDTSNGSSDFLWQFNKLHLCIYLCISTSVFNSASVASWNGKDNIWNHHKNRRFHKSHLLMKTNYQQHYTSIKHQLTECSCWTSRPLERKAVFEVFATFLKAVICFVYFSPHGPRVWIPLLHSEILSLNVKIDPLMTDSHTVKKEQRQYYAGHSLPSAIGFHNFKLEPISLISQIEYPWY